VALIEKCQARYRSLTGFGGASDDSLFASPSANLAGCGRLAAIAPYPLNIGGPTDTWTIGDSLLPRYTSIGLFQRHASREQLIDSSPEHLNTLH
jgi:hypothetical protein